MERLRTPHRFHLWFATRLPEWALYRPEGVWFALAAVLDGAFAGLGIAQPGSIESVLPDAVVRIWGASLLTGGITLMCGLTSIRRHDDVLVLSRPNVYKLGLRILMWASVFFVLCIWVSAGWRGFAASILIAAFAATNLVRLNQVVTTEALGIIRTQVRNGRHPL